MVERARKPQLKVVFGVRDVVEGDIIRLVADRNRLLMWVQSTDVNKCVRFNRGSQPNMTTSRQLQTEQNPVRKNRKIPEDTCQPQGLPIIHLTIIDLTVP
ncbi:hypothetical protein PROFUN_15424 [Planoprotostelium fungivorum]|uniref:Uncharacterized protein n=1 Tax=Planoprotostelium fungivorum TaxID=1890364 RepID=A0A2P6MWQ6_9EUKA|nr:hypothetical protein PROFUN_15424 [Planoprotostelium fungivorum]